ncbi:MAG: hypothetical protein QOJ63_1144 [Solirubrobacteraceae bacterium]|nr:hypothetical protein [Solirubrobacteraceae bacterium]
MRRILTSVLVLSATLAAAPAVAATLTTDTSCYQETQDVVVSGAGYRPTDTVAISRDGMAFGTADTNAAGAFQVKFPAPELPRGEREQVFTLTATDAALNVAEVRYRTSKVFADFTPDSGNPKTLQVRFSISGFALLRAHPTVYLHYVAPSGKARRTVNLGTAHGSCGRIEQTRRRRLFPFAAERGRWVLQFDTSKTYSRATSKSKYIWVRKPVEIFTR